MGRSDIRSPRLFVALRFPDEVTDALADIAHGVPDASWGPSEQYHLTLRFIGDPSPLSIRDVARALRDVRAPAFRINLRGTGHFPLRGDPEILWAGVEDNPALTSLRNRVEAALRRAGIPSEGRNFHPHVTLANVKACDPRDVGEFQVANGLFRLDGIEVTEFHLCSSVLRPEGAEHTVEESYSLETRSEVMSDE
jgi:RNA 2',3'-cyclic 3'-phosphodiesterase